jgi:hypothetical protein
MQLQKGITDVEDRKQREICAMKYKRKDEMDKGKLSEIDLEREEECGICMEMNSKVVLPICSHSMCMRCYRSWYAQSIICSLLSYYKVRDHVFIFSIGTGLSSPFIFLRGEEGVGGR